MTLTAITRGGEAIVKVFSATARPGEATEIVRAVPWSSGDGRPHVSGTTRRVAGGR